MQKENLNVYFRESLSNINFNGDFVAEIKREMASKSDEIRIPDEFFQSPQVLTFAIADNKYIKAHLDEIKPLSKDDGHLKLCAYTKYNAYLDESIIQLFVRCRKDFNFRFYHNVTISGEKYNPFHIYAREHIVKEQINNFNKENLIALSKLMALVDFKEKDHKKGRATDYILKAHIDIRLPLAKIARKVNTNSLVVDLINFIDNAIDKNIPRLAIPSEYLEAMQELPKYKRFKSFAETHKVILIPISGKCEIIVLRNKSYHCPILAA